MLLITLIAVLFLFAVVVLVGAPYLPTFTKQRESALDLLDLKKGQTLLELGCGDGRMLISAAKRGIRSVGYEINPILALYSWLATYRYRSLVKVVYGNYWAKNWSDFDGIYVFLRGSMMHKLDTKIIQSAKKPVKLASYAFLVLGRTVSKQKNGVFLYKYPGKQVT